MPISQKKRSLGLTQNLNQSGHIDYYGTKDIDLNLEAIVGCAIQIMPCWH
jgi:hypothetical protein